jgi:hypothetical protein
LETEQPVELEAKRELTCPSQATQTRDSKEETTYSFYLVIESN